MKRFSPILVVIGVLALSLPIVAQRISLLGDPAEVAGQAFRWLILPSAVMALVTALICNWLPRQLPTPPRWLFWAFLLASTYLLSRVLYGELAGIVGILITVRNRALFGIGSSSRLGRDSSEQELGAHRPA